MTVPGDCVGRPERLFVHGRVTQVELFAKEVPPGLRFDDIECERQRRLLERRRVACRIERLRRLALRRGNGRDQNFNRAQLAEGRVLLDVVPRELHPRVHLVWQTLDSLEERLLLDGQG